MKPNWKNIENFLVFIFFFILPFGRRHIFFNFGYQFGDFAAVAFYVSDIIAILLIVMMFFKKDLWRKTTQNRIFVLLIAFLVIESIFSPHETFSTFSLIKWIELALIFLFFSVSKVSYATILKSLSVSGLFQALIGIGQFLKQSSLNLRFLGESVISPTISGVAKIDTATGKFIRAYGTFAHPNQLAAFIIAACATTLVLFLEEQDKIQKFFYLAAAFFLILAEILSFSRAGWLGLAIMLAIVLFLPRGTKMEKSHKNKVFWVMGAGILAIILTWPFLGSRITVTDSSTTNRIYYDLSGLRALKQSPILGFGLGQLMPTMAKVETYTQNWQIQPPHNYFLDVACETGLLGLLVISYIFLKLLYDLSRRLKTGDSQSQNFKIFLFAVLIAFIILMQFDHYFYTLQQTQLLLWAILGIICGTVFRETDLKKSRAYS